MARPSDGGRQSWFGAKRYIKQALARPAPHALMRGALKLCPSLASPRLPAPASVSEVTAEVGGVSFTMLDPARCEIAKELYWGRGRRPRPEDQFALELVIKLVADAGTFFDVGAYTGIFSLAVASNQSDVAVHAFEIIPAVVTMLRANIDRNMLQDRIEVHAEGVGQPGKTMTVPDGEGGSALPSFYSSRMRFREGTQVPFRSLDSLSSLVSPGRRVVMKIDVEGTEDDILANGQEFLARYRPDMICEILHHVADGERLASLIDGFGYQFYLVTPSGLSHRDELVPDPELRDWLLSCRPMNEIANLQP